MRELFNDILNMEGVKGLMMFSFAGETVYKEFNKAQPEGIESTDWSLFIQSLAGMREADLIYKKGRLYIRKTDIGYLVALMWLFVPIAMMRLQCDILLPSLKPAKAAKGIRRLFKK
jgi:hypothetical protein